MKVIKTHMETSKNLKNSLENNKIPKAQRVINQDQTSKIFNKNKIITSTKIQTLKAKCIN